MTVSKTYNAVAGTNYIENSDLFYTKVYAVKRTGIQYDLYDTTENRRYNYIPSQGRIYFPFVFETDETVFVIYKTTSFVQYPIPGVCAQVSYIPVLSMPNGLTGSNYSYSFLFFGSLPFNLTNIVKPSWATVTASTSIPIVTISGTPTVAQTEAVSFDISNCNGAYTDSVSGSFQTLSPASNNIFIDRAYSYNRVMSVTGISFLITSGNMPAILAPNVTGVHGAYTGTITVKYSNIPFPRTARLFKNAVQIQTIPVPSAVTVVFSSETYLSGDTIQILLN